MNILNIVYDFWPGGVERLAIDVSNELKKQGHNACLCIISEHYSNSLLEQLSPDVKLYKLSKSNKHRKLSYIRQLIDIIDKQRIQVVHVHQGSIMPFYLLVKLCRPNIKIYYTSHDTHIFSDLSKLNQLISKLICDRIIAISNAVVRDIESCGVKTNKIARIYNGTNFSRFNNRLHIDNSIPNIVNVARFFPKKKGQDLLIEAASILKQNGYNFHIIFAGGETKDAPNAINEMKDLAQEKNVSDRVSFLGNVTDIPDLLISADVFCIPSRYEGFGISAVEAMGVGLPCVASNVEGLNEVVDKPELGKLFQSGSAKNLAQQLAYVLDNLKSYDARFISRDARKRFSISHMVEQLVSVYQEN